MNIREMRANEVCGWIHLQIQEDMLTESKGEIRAFVVDVKQRSRGIGKTLLKAAEEWFREQDVDKYFCELILLEKMHIASISERIMSLQKHRTCSLKNSE